MRFTKILIATILLWFGLTNFNVLAMSPEQQQQISILYNKGDYHNILRLTQPLAEQGDAIAQGILGEMHLEGKGTKQDEFKAFV